MSDDDDDLIRAQVSQLWAEDWDCAEDAIYDDAPFVSDSYLRYHNR